MNLLRVSEGGPPAERPWRVKTPISCRGRSLKLAAMGRRPAQGWTLVGTLGFCPIGAGLGAE